MQKRTLSVIVFLVFGFKLFAQVNNAENIIAKFNSYTSNHFQEKIFVHTDRNFYLSGETLWFKIYNISNHNKELTTISKIAYVEIINSENKPVLQTKISLADGTGNGQFVLPLALQTGNYLFRAYTNWMKNFSEEVMFEKTISVVNAFEKNETDTITKTVKYDVQFFPEGGNLVNNIQSKIAFKAINSNGFGVQLKGKIINQDNQTIQVFEANKYGIGSFLFNPQIGNAYKAIVYTNNNDSSVYALPKIFETGFVMQAIDNGKTTTITVNASNTYNNSLLTLIIHNNNIVHINKSQTINNNQTVFIIDNSLFKDGINHITLFNQNLIPVCERLFYKRPTVNAVLETAINNKEFNSRDKVNITLAGYNNHKQLVESNLSVSVFKTDSLQQDNDFDIQQYFWLLNELKGNIEDPSYYLNTINDETNIALDNLILTQGWRRFNWDNILQNPTTPKYLPEYESQIITGKVIDKKSLTPVDGVGVYLSIPGKDFGFTAAQTNSTGSFFALMPFIFNSTDLIAQTNNRTDSNYRVDINNQYWEKYSNVNITNLSVSKANESLLNNYGISVQANHIYHSKPLFKETQNYSPFFAKPDETYYLDNYTRFSTMEEVMREYVAGVSVRKRANKFVFHTVDAPRFQFFNTEPLILLDGIPVFDADKIIFSDPLKIKKIEVVTRKFYYGNFAFDGITSFTSYDGKLGASVLHAESLVLDYNALQQEREFYAPKYDVKENKESRIPDYRVLLYWSGNVKTNTTGTTEIEFYTSDLKGKYTALIQGVTQHGEPIKSTIQFNVNN
jgi:Tfp pilus assembly protein PilZ